MEKDARPWGQRYSMEAGGERDDPIRGTSRSLSTPRIRKD